MEGEVEEIPGTPKTNGQLYSRLSGGRVGR